jgi:hypothetical protein
MNFVTTRPSANRGVKVAGGVAKERPKASGRVKSAAAQVKKGVFSFRSIPVP